MKWTGSKLSLVLILMLPVGLLLQIGVILYWFVVPAAQGPFEPWYAVLITFVSSLPMLGFILSFLVLLSVLAGGIAGFRDIFALYTLGMVTYNLGLLGLIILDQAGRD